MKKISIFAGLIAIFAGFLGYFTSNNIYIGLGIAGFYILYFIIFLYRPIKRYFSRLLRVHECYYFINTFLITMSVKTSLNDAYASATSNSSKGFQLEMNHIGNLNINERLEYLRKYFNLSIYRMFINIVNLHLEQGNDILAMGKPVINEMLRIEEYCVKAHRLAKRKAVEFTLLWLMTFIVLLVMRYGIADFYTTMIGNPIFLVLICVFYLVFIISVHLLINKFTYLSLKEDLLNEKIQG